MSMSVKKLAYQVLSQASKRLGYRLYAANVSWHKDLEFKAIWEKFPDRRGLIHDRRFALYNLAKAFSNVPGDIAETGVRWGRTSHVMLMANAKNGKHLFGFDSFEGVSKPEAADAGNEAWSINELASDEKIAHQNLAQWVGRYTLYKGWIPARFTEVEDMRFSIVHIDVDLYGPTKDSLEFFYPRLNDGGLVVCDDYGSQRCPGAKRAMDDFAHAIGRTVVHLPTAQGVIFK